MLIMFGNLIYAPYRPLDYISSAKSKQSLAEYARTLCTCPPELHWKFYHNNYFIKYVCSSQRSQRNPKGKISIIKRPPVKEMCQAYILHFLSLAVHCCTMHTEYYTVY